MKLRERALRALTYWEGVPRVVNGVPLRVAAPVRAVFVPHYDAPAADLLRREIRPGSVVWNVGANVGVYVLQMAAWVGPTGRVVAFEPNPESARWLRENLKLNDFHTRVDVVELAIGDMDGEIDLYTKGTDGMSRPGRPNPVLIDPAVMRVPIATLDTVLAQREQTPSWIMMDIEGWEIAALQGARTLLRSTRVVVELHPSAWGWSGHDRRDLERLLDEYELEAIPLAGQVDPLGEHGQVFLQRKAHPSS